MLNSIMAIRPQLLMWLLLSLLVGVVIAQAPSTLEFTLYHQLINSDSTKDIVPRGIISYDGSRNTATLTEQSENINFASMDGIYRIGLYDLNANKKELSPAAFTKLVFPIQLRQLMAGKRERPRHRGNNTVFFL